MPHDVADASANGRPAATGKLTWLAAVHRDRCVYCNCPTWLPWQWREERKLREQWDMPARRSLACQLAFPYRRATVEHLRRQVDGGDDHPSNLALACAYCNSSRAARAPTIHAIVMCGLKRVGRHPCFPR